MQIAVDEVVKMHPSDVSPLLRKIETAKPDIMSFKRRTEGVKTVARQIRDMKVHVPLLVMSRCEASNIIKRIGKAAESVLA